MLECLQKLFLEAGHPLTDNNRININQVTCERSDKLEQNIEKSFKTKVKINNNIIIPSESGSKLSFQYFSFIFSCKFILKVHPNTP